MSYIETTKTNDKIEVSEAIYRKITAQSYGEGGAKVYDIIEGITEFNFWQKLSILQSFYLKGASLPNDLKGRMPTREVFERGNNCKCGLFMTVLQDAQPATRSGGIYLANVTGPSTVNFGRRGKTFKLTSTLGPAKFMELNQTSRREADNITYNEQNDALAGKSVYATLLYNLKCEKVVGNIPEECSCERPIKVKYRYNTKLEAKSDATATVYDSSANSTAQEVATLTVINEKTDAISIIDAGAWMAASECKKDYNEEFTLAVFDLGESIFNSYSKVIGCAAAAAVNPVLGLGCEIYQSIVKKQKTQKIIDDIKTLITTPLYNPTECTQDEKAGGISGYTNIVMKSGEPVQVTLNTGSYLSCKGKRTWANNARITTSLFACRCN